MTARFGTALTLLLSGGLAVAGGTSFEQADENGNGQISKDEFYGTVTDVGTFSNWDNDGDGLVDENEFNEIGFDYDYDYDTWDANDDGYLDSDEFYDGYFTAYDDDEDGYWSDGEWDDAGDAGLFDV